MNDCEVHVQLSFRIGFDTFSTGEQTASRDTEVQEGAVVTASAELGGGALEQAAREPVLEGCFDVLASWWTSTDLREGSTVTVVNEETIVGGGNHVEVEVQGNLLSLFIGEVGDIVLGANETELLSSPEAESNSVLNAEESEVEGHFEDTHGTRTIIVDTLD